MSKLSIDVGIAQIARPGEQESGDRYVVKASAHRTLIGVIDGVGHGREAARAADAAVEVLGTFKGETVSSLMRRCHERLRQTRGAAITLMVLDTSAHAAEWVGAGNVAVVVLQTEASGKKACRELLVRGGIAGSKLPSTEASTLPVHSGDTVVLATDGVHRKFVNGVAAAETPQQLAEQLLARYATLQDDALVLVARLADRLVGQAAVERRPSMPVTARSGEALE
jgi:phosphoserine phosphatase RsbX